jgi:hypothetical protein
MRRGDLLEEYDDACAEHIEMLACDLAAADDEIADLQAQLECAKAGEAAAIEAIADASWELRQFVRAMDCDVRNCVVDEETGELDDVGSALDGWCSDLKDKLRELGLMP